MLPNRFILTIFSFYFFYLLFYLGHGHVAGLGTGLGNLTSSLSARARVYGNTRLWSLPVDLGSDRTCLTLERCTVTWQDGCGHTNEHSAILQVRLLSLSAAFWWGVIGTTNKTICGTIYSLSSGFWYRASNSCLHKRTTNILAAYTRKSKYYNKIIISACFPQ